MAVVYQPATLCVCYLIQTSRYLRDYHSTHYHLSIFYFYCTNIYVEYTIGTLHRTYLKVEFMAMIIFCPGGSPIFD
jgi:hypothetical protein